MTPEAFFVPPTAAELAAVREKYRIREDDQVALEAAKASGYLVVGSRAANRARLEMAYSEWCQDLRPIVVIVERRRWARVGLDTLLLPRRPGDAASCWKLTAETVQRIAALLGELTRPGADWAAGPVKSHSEAVAITLAPALAQRLFTIANDDFRQETDHARQGT